MGTTATRGRATLLCAAALLAAALGPAAAQSISDDALLAGGAQEHGGGGGAGGRRLLQAKKNCAVNFQTANYTVITSRCKGPTYPPALCCGAFKDFACQYADYINDDTTNCAATMFSYIELHGMYPSGLFADTCREGKDGLTCPDDTPPPSKAAASSVAKAPVTTVVVVAVFASLLLLTMSF